MGRIEDRQSVLKVLFSNTFGVDNSSELDNDFKRNLFFGIKNNQDIIDHLIKQNIKNWSFERISRIAKCAMRIGIYEMINGDIPVCKEISMEMNRIDQLIDNPGVYYDSDAVEGYIKFCENELTLTDGSDLVLLDSFKLWAEQVFGWYYFVEVTSFEPNKNLCTFSLVRS